MTPSHGRELNRRSALAYFAVWIPFAALYYSATFLRQTAGPIQALRTTLIDIGCACASGLAIWGIVRRVEAGSPTERRRLVTYVAAVTGFAIFNTTLGIVAEWLRTWNTPLAEGPPIDALWQFMLDVSLGTALLAVFVVMEQGRRLAEETTRAVTAERERGLAELTAIRAQLSPHFMFNALHAITALSNSEPQRVGGALERYAFMVRYSLDLQHERRDEVRLSDELAFARAYLELERLRYGERLRVIEEIDPEALDYFVLSYSLQTLVENSIRHGIMSRPEGGTIWVKVRADETHLTVEVRDDGSGAQGETVQRSTGIGLSALRNRIAARYKGEATVDVLTSPGAGFQVRMVLPAVSRPAPLPS